METITGHQLVDQLLGRLESGATQIAERATLAAAGPYVNHMKALAPVGTAGRKYKGQTIRPGGVRRSIGRRRLSKLREGFRGAKVGLNVGGRRRSRSSRAPHAHLVALGTTTRTTGLAKRRRRGGRVSIKLNANPQRNRGKMPANDFVRRAIARAESEGDAELRRVVFAEIDKLANR